MDPVTIVLLIGLIICVGVGAWLFSKKNDLTRDLSQATTRNERLSGELEELTQKHVDLGNDLTQTTTRCEDLEQRNATLDIELSQATQTLEEAKQLNARLSGELEQVREQFAALESELLQANQQCADLEGQLAQAQQRVAALESQLSQANERIANLESTLGQANKRIATLETELAQVRQHRASLETELAQERQRCKHLETDLALVAQSNQAALWGLYLCEVSLQVCGAALRSESNRSKRLVGHYRRLEQTYSAFRDDVQSKARQRMVRKGIGVALALIPGVGLIDLLSDLGEIASAASTAGDAALDADEIKSALSEVQESVDSPGADVVTLEESEFLSASTETDAMPIVALTPEAQSAVKEKFLEQELGPDTGTLALTTPPPFVAGMIQRTKELVDSVSEEERRKAMAIVKTANNFQQLGIEAHNYRTSQDLPEEEDASSG